MFIEFIAFIMTMLILIFLMGRRAREERKKMQDPEYVRKQKIERERILKELYGALNIEEEEEKEEPKGIPATLPPSTPIRTIPKRKGRKEFEFTPSLEDHSFQRDIEKRRLAPTITEETIHIGDEPIVSPDLSFDDRRAYLIQERGYVPKVQRELKYLASPKKMLIYHEIFGKPKAFQPFKSHEFPFT